MLKWRMNLLSMENAWNMEMLMLRMNTFVELGCSEFCEETIPIYTESCHPSLGSSTILRRFVLKICHILNWDVLFNTVCISVLYSKFVFVFLYLLCSSTSYSTAQRCCAETLANALSEPKWQSWVFKAASKIGGIAAIGQIKLIPFNVNDTHAYVHAYLRD